MAGTVPRAAPRVGPLFGRQDILDEAQRFLDETREGAGRLVALSGPAGVGKSTVLQAIVSSASQAGYRVLAGRALPVELPEPFALVKQMLSPSETVNLSAGRSDQASGPVGLPLFAMPYGVGAGGSPSLPPGGDTAGDEADRILSFLVDSTQRVDASRTALFGRLREAFISWSEEQPLLLAIDDLHFADASSLEFLEAFLPAIQDHQVMVVATVAPSTDTPPPTAAAVERILGGPSTHQMQVRPMTEPELEQFVRWILNGRDPGRDNVMRWFSQTEGNPLFAEQLVRASTGATPTAGASGSARPDLAAVLRQRIRDLPEVQRRALVYGAVLGKEFSFAALAAASSEEEERLSESLDHLVREGLLREKVGEVYEFVTEAVRAEIYSRLTETRRRILHRKVGRALEGLGPANPATVGELARQYYLGRDDGPSVEFNRRAADLAARAFAFETALTHLQRALESARRLPKRDPSLEILLAVEAGRLQDEAGELRRSEETLLDAVARARGNPQLRTELALALLGLARTRTDLSEYARARELATEAFEILKNPPNEQGLLAAHQVLGVACWRIGDLPVAEAHQREQIALADRVGSMEEQGHARVDLANTLTVVGRDRFPEALALYDQVAELFQSSDDYAARSRVLMNRALLRHNVGRMDEAIVDMREAIRFAERSRSKIWIGYSAMNMAQLCVEAHRLEEARKNLEIAATTAEELEDALARQQVAMIRGMLLEEEGHFDAAEGGYDIALRLAREMKLGPEVAEMELRLSKLHLKTGDTSRAREMLDAARRDGILTVRGDLVEDVARLEVEIQSAVPVVKPSN